MTEQPGPAQQHANFIIRTEQQLLRYLPAFVTPLRLRIAAGYCVVVIVGFLAWEHVESAWRYFVALLAPIGALLGAVLALKLSVVVVSLFTLLSSLIKVFSGFLMVVLKPGILKAIFMPPLMALVKWIHKQSSMLQHLASRLYERAIDVAKSILRWWQKQNLIDKALLSSFLIPLLVIIFVVFLIERATASFAVKKITEQIVQKTTKFMIKQVHRLPLVTGISDYVAARAKRLTRQEDREDLAYDLKNLQGKYNHTEVNTDTTTPSAAQKNTQ